VLLDPFTTSSTTSTTLPPPPCSNVAGISAISCRLRLFLADVQGRSDLGKIQSKLVARIQKAEGVVRADSLLTKGRKRQAKGVLRKAARQLRSVGKFFRSRAGRKVPPETRTDVVTVAGSIATDIQTVVGALD
jgi:hypothetical protein